MLLVPEADRLGAASRASGWELRRMPLGNVKWCRTTESSLDTPDTPATPTPEPTGTCDLSAEETKYLLDLCRQFDNRFIIVADRYKYANSDGTITQRTAQEIKRRHHQLHHLHYDDEQQQRRRLAEESFDARTREQVEEEQQLLRLLVHTQRDLSTIWRRRQSMIARLAGDTFVMNNPSLLDLIGHGVTDPDVPADPPRSRPTTGKTSKKSKVKRAVVEAPPTAPTATASATSPPTQPTNPKRQSVTPVLRTASLKPIKAGMARLVDKRLVEMGLPVRPNYPSERNCELYEQIRTLMADQFDAKKP